jgi:predicted protein tyrosine phosphatase
MSDMAASPCIKLRIDPQIKLRLQAIATRELSESAMLKRLVIAAVGMAPSSDARVLAIQPIDPPTMRKRVIDLRTDQLRFLSIHCHRGISRWRD